MSNTSAGRRFSRLDGTRHCLPMDSVALWPTAWRFAMSGVSSANGLHTNQPIAQWALITNLFAGRSVADERSDEHGPLTRTACPVLRPPSAGLRLFIAGSDEIARLEVKGIYEVSVARYIA